MKLLTLNTHSLEEPDTPAKQRIFAGEILKLQPDIIALQEVNQTMTAPRRSARTRLYPRAERHSGESRQSCPGPDPAPGTGRPVIPLELAPGQSRL